MHVSALKTGQSKGTIFIKATADILHCLKWWGLCGVVGVRLERKYQEEQELTRLSMVAPGSAVYLLLDRTCKSHPEDVFL
jgi:hypothetical protein